MSQDHAVLISLLIDIPTVTTWIGLCMFDAFVMFTPGIAEEQRARLVVKLRWVTLLLIAVIMATGVLQTIDSPFHHVDSYSSLEYLRHHTTYGQSLFFKHIFVVGTFGLSLVNRFYLAPRAQVALTPDGGEAVAAESRLLSLATLLNLAFCLGVLLATARMTFQLH